MRPRRVLLVDDLLVESDAIGIALDTAADLVLVGRRAMCDSDLLADVSRLQPDLILVDVEQAGPDTDDLLAAIAVADPAALVIVLTGSEDSALAVRAARAGASAWVEKSSSLADVVDVLREVGHGEASWPRRHLGPVLRALRADAAVRGAPPERLATLNARERRNLAGMRAGTPLRQLARELSVPVSVVCAQQTRILAKLSMAASSARWNEAAFDE